jgi:hypothetical protein
MARGLRIGYPRQYRFFGEQGAYAHTGQTAGLNRGRTVAAELGEYFFDGRAATLSTSGSTGGGFVVPTITFTFGVASSHDLTQYVSGYTSAMTLLVQGTALPTGVTFNGTHLVYNGSGAQTTVSGVRLVVISDSEESGSGGSNPYSSLAAGAWLALPNTTIRTVLPTGTTGNPVNITDAWSGGTIDTLRHRMLVWGGGHNDYNGNEVYAVGYGPTASVARIRDPGGSPVSRHTYGAISYIAHTDEMYSTGGATSPLGSIDKNTWCLNLANPNVSGSWASLGNAPVVETFGYMSCYDPATQRVYLCDRNNLMSFVRSSASYTTHKSISNDITLYFSACIDSTRRRFLMFGNGRGVSVLLDSPYTETTLSMSNVPTQLSDDSPGVVYDPVGDRVVLWSGGNNVYAWPAAGGAWSQIATSGGPGQAASDQGTFGRWGYDPTYKVCVLVNTIDTNCYVFKLAAG